MSNIKKSPTIFQKIYRLFFGWAIIPYVSNKNDRLAAVFIGYAMNGWEIPKEAFERKWKYYRWCQWWGCAD